MRQSYLLFELLMAQIAIPDSSISEQESVSHAPELVPP